MCGIAGIINLDRKKRKQCRSLHLMAQSMRNRGPDDEGYLLASFQTEKPVIFGGDDTPECKRHIAYYPSRHICSAYDTASSVFLAHRRLSIIDLSPFGHQPLCTPDGRYWIVFNGEIYNYREIREELKASGILFQGNSDTEVLLHAYGLWKEKALHRFNGMFAFAIWDDKEKTLFCARDRIGIKPFYYTVQENTFIFASDIMTLIQGGIYKPRVGLEGLYLAMSFGVAPRPLTAFKDVYGLEQGHWMMIDSSGSFRNEPYWSIPTGSQDTHLSERDSIELIEQNLRKSVEYRLVADVPVGTFMSGGIDSTTVSAISSQLHPGIKAFTLSYDDADKFDELAQAQSTARMYPMEHVVKKVNADSVLEHIEDIVTCYEEPFNDVSPNYVISKFVRENDVTVVLNGLGGDELFGGYPYYRLVDAWRILRKISFIRKLFRLLAKKKHLYDRMYNVISVDTPDRYHTALRSYFSDREKNLLFSDPACRDFNTVERVFQLYVGNEIEFTDAHEAVSYMDMMNYIGNHHVYRVDKFTMRFSIEGRVPLLDHNVVESAYRIPSRFKFKLMEPKYVLRKIARKYIHPSCLRMKKKGFSFPTDQWMRNQLSKMVEENLVRLQERDLFQPDIIKGIYKSWLEGKRSYECIWHLVSVEIWLEKFMDRHGN